MLTVELKDKTMDNIHGRLHPIIQQNQSQFPKFKSFNKQITPPMPISNNHRLRHIFRRRHQNLLLFLLKCAIMFAVISLFLFFLGFAAIVLLHFLFVPNNNRQNKENAENKKKQQLLPDVVYTESDFKDSSESCPICLDCFKEGDVSWFLPDCKHLFHARCVDKWIFKRPTCPVCRTRVSLDPLPGCGGYDDGDHWKRLWTSSTVHFHASSSYN